MCLRASRPKPIKSYRLGLDMKLRSFALPLLISTASIGSYVEHRANAALADKSIGMIDPRQTVLHDSLIRPDWILEGPAHATSGLLGQTHDGSAQLMVWRVSQGRFNWFYDFDESVTILDGEVFLTEGANAAPGNPKERRLEPGDVAFFHIGSVATWRVPDHVRKIATIKYPLPTPVASLYRWYVLLRGWASPTSAVAAL